MFLMMLQTVIWLGYTRIKRPRLPQNKLPATSTLCPHVGFGHPRRPQNGSRDVHACMEPATSMSDWCWYCTMWTSRVICIVEVAGV